MTLIHLKLNRKKTENIVLTIVTVLLGISSILCGYNLLHYHEKTNGYDRQYCFTGIWNDEHCDYDYGFSESGTMILRFLLSFAYFLFMIGWKIYEKNEKYHWFRLTFTNGDKK